MREIDTEHNWFWREGYKDGLAGERRIVPDEARHPFQRSDYFAGYDAGSEDFDGKMKLNEESES